MYPVFRLLQNMMKSYRAAPLGLKDEGELSFYCRPWDIDPFMEMNNGRILTLFDLGRFDIAVRTGLWRMLKEQKWGLAVAGSSVRYRRRITVFDKVTMKTRLVGVRGRWFYIEQSMWVKGQPCVSVLLRTCVIGNRKAIESKEVFAALGESEFDEALPDWVQAWVAGDDIRPWPPMS